MTPVFHWYVKKPHKKGATNTHTLEIYQNGRLEGGKLKDIRKKIKLENY